MEQLLRRLLGEISQGNGDGYVTRQVAGKPPSNKQKGVMNKSIKVVAASKEGDDALVIESVADILERELQSVIRDWRSRAEKEPDLTNIPLNFEDRTNTFRSY
jgi:hypothetical protein